MLRCLVAKTWRGLAVMWFVERKNPGTKCFKNGVVGDNPATPQQARLASAPKMAANKTPQAPQRAFLTGVLLCCCANLVEMSPQLQVWEPIDTQRMPHSVHRSLHNGILAISMWLSWREIVFVDVDCTCSQKEIFTTWSFGPVISHSKLEMSSLEKLEQRGRI
jgi:hypothetical protein